MLAKTALATALIVALAGCSTMNEIRSDARNTQGQAEANANAQFAGRAARHGLPVNGAIITDTPYVDARPMRRAARYPSTFNRTIVVNEPMGVPIQVLAQRVQAMTGVQMLYQSELVAGGGMAEAVAAPSGIPPELGGDSTLDRLPPLQQILPQMPQMAAPRTNVALSYTGDVVGLFNAIASATGASWEYDESGQVVQFYRYKTETFRIPAVQGESSSVATMGGQQQAAGGDGGQPITSASAEGSHRTEGSIWKDIEATIKTLLSPEGVFAISPATGTVTLRDRPDRVEQVRRYINDTAKSMARQVDVELTIYRVVTRADDVRALNWYALFESAANRYGITLSTLASRPVADGMSSLAVTIPSGGGNKWGGSQVVMDALSTLGRTSVEQSTSIVTSNNQPAPFKVVRRTSYLKQVSQGMTQTGGVGLSTGPTLTPGTIETGLNMYVIPHVQDDGKRMKIRMMASISTLERMATVGTRENFIQTPETASREFQSEAWLNSGETFVVAGFQQVDSGLDTRSPLDKSLWFFGGSSEARNSREIVVIAIRPVVTAARSRI